MIGSAIQEFIRVLELEPEDEMGADAREAIEALDGHQMRQILMLATEDMVFRAKLRRSAEEATRERGFALSFAGIAALQNVDFDSLAELQRSTGYPHYN
jgi:hypothetical protein